MEDDQIKIIQQSIDQIAERNKRVEADKAWERSLTRISSITLLTYVIAATWLYSIGASNYLLSAMLPALGFLLSVQSLPLIKRWWIKRNIK